jgi:hypothetical protein
VSKEYLEKLRQYYRLVDYRENILMNISQIEKILKEEFPEENLVAYQHWIPQIKTAITSDSRWLSRGDYNFDYTLKKIEESNILDNDGSAGIYKYTK